MIKELGIFHYFPIAGGRTDGFISFLMSLAQSEIQTRIWTQVNYSISYDDSHYALLMWMCIYIYIYMYMICTKNVYIFWFIINTMFIKITLSLIILEGKHGIFWDIAGVQIARHSGSGTTDNVFHSNSI